MAAITFQANNTRAQIIFDEVEAAIITRALTTRPTFLDEAVIEVLRVLVRQMTDRDFTTMLDEIRSLPDSSPISPRSQAVNAAEQDARRRKGPTP